MTASNPRRDKLLASMKDELIFFVNGLKISLETVDPTVALSSFLRRQLRLTGTKVSCEEGSCGSCTVMISSYNPDTDQVRHKAVTSCLVPIGTLHGMAITTIEGLGNLRSRLNCVQERLVKYHGTQCGFCTPGMVMSMYTLLRNSPQPTLQEITTSIQGNICRCTGYRSVMEAFGTYARDYCCSDTESSCCLKNGANCCRKEIDENVSENLQGTSVPAIQTSESGNYNPIDDTQELIFPPELKVAPSVSGTVLSFEGDHVTWCRPSNLEQAVNFLEENPGALIAAGCTQLKVKVCSERQVVLDVSQLRELRDHVVGGSHVVLGAAMTMSDVIQVAEENDNVSAVLSAIPAVLASWHSQLRNAATLGGHVVSQKPVYDLIPLLVAGECVLNAVSKGGIRKVSVNSDRSWLQSRELLVSVEFPVSLKKQFVRTYKVAKRKGQDFPFLSAAFVLDLDPDDNGKVTRARLVFGGSVPAPVIASKTASFFTGRVVTESLRDEAELVLSSELTDSGLSRDQLFVARGFLTKLIIELLASKQQNRSLNPSETPSSRDPRFKSKQVYEINRDGEFSEVKVVGQPLTHSTAEEQVTGEAVYVDDTAPSVDELFLHLVLSTRPLADISGIELQEALALPHVKGYVDCKDIPGVNLLYAFMDQEQPVFASDTVYYCGQVISGIIADDRETAMKAADLVHVTYREKSPAILTLKDAISAESFLGEPRLVTKGDTVSGFAESDQILEGELNLHGQKHFYMETQSTLATPKERGEMEVLAATQMPSQLHASLALVLDVPAHKINVRVKRLGGAFGGKETPSFLTAVPAAVAAVKYGRPVRCVLSRRDDTLVNGGRHALLVRYKVGFKNSGKIMSLEMRVYLNGGYMLGLSQSVMEQSVVRVDFAYNIPSMRVEGRVCRTNHSDRGAFRGYGAPQTAWAVENIIADIATHVGRNPDEIRSMNLKADGDRTLDGVVLKDSTLRQCWEECKALANYEQRLQHVIEFNRKNVTRKRGLTLQPTLYSLGFGVKVLNQAGALVHVYTDGSVLVTHGGCEMGQGLHTKIKQIASETLGIHFDKVLISETATNLVPNVSPSAGSVTTDLNGAAVYAACLTLLERLRPFREADPSAGWDKWVFQAYFDRVSLSATGFCKFGDFAYDFVTGKGENCLYQSFGAGCSEVELDCLTGQHTLIRTDIVMDVGRSLNPAIDIGQIEGAFVQGYGHFMLEDEVYDAQGRLLTDSFLTYKVPLCTDIPAEFNVGLLKKSVNKKAIYSSKGVGEPPLLLSVSVYLALKEAVRSAREDRGLGKMFVLPTPAIPANVISCLAD